MGPTAAACGPLTDTPDDEHEASFSPDGRAIVFVRSVAEAGGGTAMTSTRCAPAAAGSPASPRQRGLDEFDPRYFAGGIVFSRGESSDRPSAYADVYTMKRNGASVRPLVAGAGSAYVEDVTPDGHLVLFRRDRGLWVKKIGAGAARKLCELPDGSKTNAVFSSDGKPGRRLHRSRRRGAARLDRVASALGERAGRRVRTSQGRRWQNERHDRPGHHLAAEPRSAA